jgi:hypothetical protein
MKEIIISACAGLLAGLTMALTLEKLYLMLVFCFIGGLCLGIGLILLIDKKKWLIRKFEQALEMEKQQIIDAHGLIAKLQDDGSHKLISGETYYNETYKLSA